MLARNTMNHPIVPSQKEKESEKNQSVIEITVALEETLIHGLNNSGHLSTKQKEELFKNLSDHIEQLNNNNRSLKEIQIYAILNGVEQNINNLSLGMIKKMWGVLKWQLDNFYQLNVELKQRHQNIAAHHRRFAK